MRHHHARPRTVLDPKGPASRARVLGPARRGQRALPVRSWVLVIPLAVALVGCGGRAATPSAATPAPPVASSPASTAPSPASAALSAACPAPSSGGPASAPAPGPIRPALELSGDAWSGDLVADGQRIYLATREQIVESWGTIRIRWSDDGGATWSAPVTLSDPGVSESARNTLALAPDGTLWAAWVERNPNRNLQSLLIRRSVDRGATWTPATYPLGSGALTGLPALLLARDARVLGLTDGPSGQVGTWPMAADGTPVNPYQGFGMGATQVRLFDGPEFYDNPDPLDAGLTLARLGTTSYAFWQRSPGSLVVSTWGAGDQGWTLSPSPTQNATAPRPRLLTAGDQLYALVSELGAGPSISPSVELFRTDGGAWISLGRVDGGLAACGGDLTGAGSAWAVTYAGCSLSLASCASSWRIWLRFSRDLTNWGSPIALSAPGDVRPIGVVHTARATCAVWLVGGSDIPARRQIIVVSIPDAGLPPGTTAAAGGPSRSGGPATVLAAMHPAHHVLGPRQGRGVI